jgi:hypothetical protein
VALGRLGWRAGRVEFLAGDAAAAEREFRQAVEIHERTENWGSLTSLAHQFAAALLALGRAEEALELSELGERLSVPEDVDAEAGWRRIRAEVLARRGAISEAELFARDAVEIARQTDYLDLRGATTATLAAVLELAGRTDEGAATRAEAIALWSQKGNVAALMHLDAEAADGQSRSRSKTAPI